jgi:hypothetical protein
MVLGIDVVLLYVIGLVVESEELMDGILVFPLSKGRDFQVLNMKGGILVR